MVTLQTRSRVLGAVGESDAKVVAAGAHGVETEGDYRDQVAVWEVYCLRGLGAKGLYGVSGQNLSLLLPSIAGVGHGARVGAWD